MEPIYTPSYGLNVEDKAHICLSFDNFEANLHLDILSNSPRRTINFEGTDGNIFADLLGPSLSIKNSTTNQARVIKSYVNIQDASVCLKQASPVLSCMHTLETKQTYADYLDFMKSIFDVI